MNILARLAVIFAFLSPLMLKAGDEDSQIKAVLKTQVDAWNHGDIPTFVTTYAPDCIFVGKQIIHGRAQVQARYEKNYPTRDAMGQLSFSALDIHLMADNVAMVTGEWHLERSATAGNPVGGVFSLVFRREGNEWKIALDHTS